MNQRGKLETIAPTFPSVALPQAPAVTEPPATVSVAHPPARAEVTKRGDESIKIDIKRTSVGLFSLSTLMVLLPGWVTSLVGHLVVIVLLAVIAVSAEDREAALQLDALMFEATTIDDADVHIEQSYSEVKAELLNLDVAAMNSEASKESIEPVHDEGMAVSLMDGLGEGIGMEAMAASGLTPVNKQDTGGVVGETEGSSTQFFGTEAKGDRFVFIIDASGSMSEAFLWQRAVTELGKSLEKLGKEQKVMVLLYNSQTIPMFNGDPEKLEMVPVSFKFRKALGQWLQQQQPFGKTMPAHALSFGLSLDPDAIFLLSDGQITDNSLQVLAALNRNRETEDGGSKGKVPVHTISLGPNELGVIVMQTIAANNDGQFTRVR